MYRRSVLATIAVLLFAAPLLGAEKKLNVYCWQGAGGGSNLADPKFVSGWRGVLNANKNDVLIELKPSRERLLEKLKTADIVYASTHSGVPKGASEQGLQVKEKGEAQFVLTAGEIAAIGAAKPKLVIINGCETIPLLEEKGGVRRNIATAFGIGPGKTPGSGRAFIGFKKSHAGSKGDSFFRVFFWFWTGGAGEADLTIKAAAVKAKAHIEAKVKAMGGDHAQELFFSNAAAYVHTDMEILGDETLRYKDLAGTP